MTLTQEKLKRSLFYDRETGVFSRLIGPYKGNAAGCIKRGYVCIKLYGESYFAHRLAWLYVFGIFPKHHTDHINRIKSDNRLSNLRDVTANINNQNKILPSINSTTNLRGVSKIKTRTSAVRWKAHICTNGIRIYLGQFDSPEKASAAYKNAKFEKHFVKK